MSIEIKVPTLPESVSDATIAKWYKNVGDRIERNENLVDLETDKVMLEVPSTAAGIIEKIISPVGATVKAGELIAVINESATAAPKAEAAAPQAKEEAKNDGGDDLSPAVRRLVAEHNIDVAQVKGSGKGGRITKEDIEAHLANKPSASAAKSAAPTVSAAPMGAREDKRVPMSRLRARIAERLVEVQSQAALLTTFNEVDMKPVMDLRAQYKDKFEKTHGVRLGFMSFFVKAVVEALKRYPIVNASIDGNDVVYHNYFDIGIAVSSPRGLVVPIIRNADLLSMAQIEQAIMDYAVKAKDGKLEMEDMMGGTFTITNGGTFGSMMSTPIINPPQSAILGMHNIVKRPVVVNDEIVIRPMMYLALSYDHRIIDGRDSVGFLVTIKELIEDPARLILAV
jgi:2-oxoglutarate dehydrogenase E2 component (dihydrolipoamide succinyltransferase)